MTEIHALSPEQRFWPKVNKEGPAPEYNPALGPCWIWQAALTDGYGSFWDGTRDAEGRPRNVPAHRFSFLLTGAAIPDGQDSSLSQVGEIQAGGHED